MFPGGAHLPPEDNNYTGHAGFSQTQTALGGDWSSSFLGRAATPQGLQWFGPIDEYFIYKKRSSTSERQKSFTIENNVHQPIFLVEEDSGYCFQMWCVANRNIVFKLKDTVNGQDVMTIECPFPGCRACSWLARGCSPATAYIKDSSTGGRLGMVRMSANTASGPSFDLFANTQPTVVMNVKSNEQQNQREDDAAQVIRDEDMQKMYRVSNRGGCYCMGFLCFEDNDFTVTNIEDSAGNDVATITRPSSVVFDQEGSCVYIVKFYNSDTLPLTDKALILGSIFVIEMMLFNGDRFD